MRAFVTAVYLALSAPALSLRSRGLTLGRAQIVLVAKLRAVRKLALKRARFRWEQDPSLRPGASTRRGSHGRR